MVSKVIYRVTAIRNHGERRMLVREFKGAPPDGLIAQWLKGGSDPKGPPPGADYAFAVRYYPTYKGWRIIDLRGARLQPSRGGDRAPTYWTDIIHSKKTYATEDAAVMVAIHLLNQPRQWEMFDPPLPGTSTGWKRMVLPHGPGVTKI